MQSFYVNESPMDQSQRRWPATAIICVICDIGLQVVICDIEGSSCLLDDDGVHRSVVCACCMCEFVVVCAVM